MTQSHVLSGLIEKRAELAGEIDAAEAHLRQLRADLVHLDSVLRLFDPDAVPEAIPPKRKAPGKGWFGPGELPRIVMDVLREAEEPLPSTAITRAAMERRSIAEGDRAALVLIAKRVDMLLRRQEGRLFERVAVGSGVRWRVRG